MYSIKSLTEFINESVSKKDLDSIEAYADRLFSKVGIDVEFTKHFLDRVNDARNKKDISVQELQGIFKRTYKFHGKKIPTLGADAQAVIKDMRTDINVPFVLEYDPKNQEFDLKAKTIMRKKNFATSNVTLDINSKLYELRDKSIYKQMRPFFGTTPEYVFRELFYANNGFFKTEFINLLDTDAEDEDIEGEFMEWTDLTWKKKVITVNIKDFSPSTQNSMKSRGMGSVHLKDVPSDKDRTETQQKLAKERADGKNEPVILIQTSKGYDLIEGWHRTMSILNLGSDGTPNYGKWDKVKLNAWIATGEYAEDASAAFGTFS